VIPLRDANPVRRTPVVTASLIAACVAVFLVELRVSSGPGGDAALVQMLTDWGAIPSRISAALDGTGDPGLAVRGIVGSLFLHAGWPHLLGNMLFLWIFGNNVEDRLGRLPYLVFYLAGGALAALAQVFIEPGSEIPLVGASGAIASTLGAYIVLYPRARITTLLFLGILAQLIEVPAVVILGFWFLLQLLDGVASLGATTAQGGVAFFAHIGGFASGALVGVLIRAAGPRPGRPGG
jgi:membrane associated rhomboid family serine protease